MSTFRNLRPNWRRFDAARSAARLSATTPGWDQQRQLWPCNSRFVLAARRPVQGSGLSALTRPPPFRRVGRSSQDTMSYVPFLLPFLLPFSPLSSQEKMSYVPFLPFP